MADNERVWTQNDFASIPMERIHDIYKRVCMGDRPVADETPVERGLRMQLIKEVSEMAEQHVIPGIPAD